jgi:hypothetical protein
MRAMIVSPGSIRAPSANAGKDSVAVALPAANKIVPALLPL